MYAVVRQYSSAQDLTQPVEENRESLKTTMKSVPGLVAYYLITDGTSVTTVTICNDQAGAEASIQKAAEWVKQTLSPDIGLSAPQITQGDVVIDITK